MSRSHAVLKFMRQVHLYIGIFATPALLFFAITGALQTFSLHEQTRGSSYRPPAILAELGQLHKKQTTVLPVRKPQAAGPDRGPDSSPKPTGRAAGGEPSADKTDAAGHEGQDAHDGHGAHHRDGAGKGDKPALAQPTPGITSAAPSQAQPDAGQAPKAADASAQQVQPPAPQKNHMPMKIFFLLVSMSLVTSTLTGLYLSYKYSRGWILITSLLVAGLIVPLLLLPF